MTTFWILTAVMTLAAVAAVMPAFFRHRRTAALNRDRQNVVIARERLAELKRERDEGGLSEEAWNQARVELEKALADDLDAGQAAAQPASTGSGRWGLAVVFILVPLLAFGLYRYLGAPQYIDVAGASAGSPQTSASPHAGGSGEPPSMDELAVMLASKLEENPNRPEGWYLLGRTYMSLQRYPEAAAAFAKLNELVGDRAEVLIARADAEAMVQGARMAGRPAELVKQALALQPDNITALWLAGKAEAEAGNYVDAIRLWRRVEAQSLNDPGTLGEIRAQIAEAQQLGNIPDSEMPAVPEAASAPGAAAGSEAASAPETASGSAGPAITVTVSLDATLAAGAAPEDTVFIYARAVDGPPMPLAVARHQVRELPITVTLTDEMAMMPQMKLSNFPRVRISARVSKTGNAITQPGDLVSEDAQVDVAAAAPVELVIDRKAP